MKNTNKYKKALEAEKAKLLKELGTIARRNPSAPSDWEAIPTDLDSDSADENEIADEVEEFGNNSAILEKLEPQLANVEKALGKIEEGSYGKCDVCEEEIDEDRLDANPASTTCIEHSK